MDPITKSLHIRADVSNAAPAATPIYQNSAFEAHSDYFYTRKNNPNTDELEKVLAEMAQTRFALATTTGMSAITMVLNLLKPGDTLVINTFVYGCSYKLFEWFCTQYQIRLITSDLSNTANWGKLPKVDMVLLETPTNPFLYTVNIQALSDQIKKKNPAALLVVDNTWATPLYQKPCKHGADISLHSATKYFSGHSDVMGGCILTDTEEVYLALQQLRFYMGTILDPNSAWLIRRSLQTLEVRLQKQGASTIMIKEYLQSRPEILHVYYPEIDGEQLTDYATLIFFTLRPELVERYPVLCQNLQLFSTGTGMACVTSMIAQPYTGSHASMDDHEKAAMGLDRSLIRLSFGLENPKDLIDDLDHAFNRMNEKQATPLH